MPGGMNLATKYVGAFNDMFYKEAQITLALKNRAEYKGAKTFQIVSFPYAPLNNYMRNGLQRYGTPNDLSRNIQTALVTQDKSFSFIIDRGDYTQSQNLQEAGRMLAREEKYVVIPAVDSYCFAKLAAAAADQGATSTTAVTTSNAYAQFLNGMQYMSDRDVPEQGRIAYCTYAYANMLKQDPAFMRYGNLSQEMINKGVIGEVDGCKIVKVSSNRLPAGAVFLLVHPNAAALAQQLEEYKLHVDPPGVSGWLCEGRVLYDCFCFDHIQGGIYYHGGLQALGALSFITSATKPGKTTLIMNCEKDDSADKWYYIDAADHASLPTATYGTAIDPTNSSDPWYNASEARGKEVEITPTVATNTAIAVVEVDASGYPIRYSTGKMNVG